MAQPLRNVIAQPTDAGGLEQEGGKAGRFGDCSEVVIGACIEVHCVPGPGVLESAYEQGLAHTLALRDLSFQRQVSVPVGLLVDLHAETIKRGLRRLGPKPPSRLPAFL